MSFSIPVIADGSTITVDSTETQQKRGEPDSFGSNFSSLELRSMLNEKVLQGDWLVDLKVVSSPPRLIPKWQANVERQSQLVRFALSEEQFGRASVANTDKGYRLLMHERYQSTAGSTRIAAIWVEQDIQRTRFAGAVRFQQSINKLQSVSPSVNVSVTAYKRKKLVFSRAFEQLAECEECVGLSAAMPFPLGRVSQGVAGVLAARLEYKQMSHSGVPFNLSLDWRTRDLMPLMPAHHTHRPIDLLSHTSCIRPQLIKRKASLEQKRASARSMLERQWNAPLISGCAPGHLQKSSATGFLYLSAFLESATGRSVEELVFEELSAVYNIPSLSAERYGSENILGLGLQSSAPDLALLLARVLNGNIMSARFRDRRFLNQGRGNGRYSFGWRMTSNRVAELSDDFDGYAARVVVDYRSGNILVMLLSGGVEPASLNSLQAELLALLAS
ncbi:MAG: serine hydrolase [Pseudomonadales bacterium]